MCCKIELRSMSTCNTYVIYNMVLWLWSSSCLANNVFFIISKVDMSDLAGVTFSISTQKRIKHIYNTRSNNAKNICKHATNTTYNICVQYRNIVGYHLPIITNQYNTTNIKTYSILSRWSWFNNLCMCVWVCLCLSVCVCMRVFVCVI